VWWRNYYCSVGRCGLAAVPGTSRHGLGRAVDFQDQQGELTFTSPGYVWLVWHAPRYGFHHPAWAAPDQPDPEPWHWEA
jgi:LAS superfamily LD-carboxypeptidase LdcB